MAKIALFYFLKQVWPSGMTTYTAQLYNALRAAGHDPMLYRVMPNPAKRRSRFGHYGIQAELIGPADALRVVRTTPSVMVASARVERHPHIAQMLKLGMRAVVHDPTEEQNYDIRSLRQRPICVRQSTAARYGGLWVPHPYERRAGDLVSARRNASSVSLARIHPMKRPAIILDANRMTPEGLRCELLGSEYRMYSHALAKKYPELFEQKRRWLTRAPLNFDWSVDTLLGYSYHVDMTKIEGDGGGTQYTHLEAMDAGCVNIVHRDWFDSYAGEFKPGKHCLIVSDAHSLAATLRTPYSDWRTIVEGGYRLLKAHDSKMIGEMFAEEVLR